MINFDEIIDRNNTQCAKYDGMEKYFNVSGAFPLWVADMDFKTPACVNDAIIKRAQHGIYGYGIITSTLKQSVVAWMQQQHHYSIQSQWLSFLNGVVPAYSACIEAFSEVDDEIIVQTPVYFPLFNSIKHNNRKVVYNPLKNDNGYYTMDLEDLKAKITPKTKILTLCSPHNPVGRVWSKEELEALAKICMEHNLIIISDEIHADLIFEKTFTPMGSISKEIEQRTVTLNAAGKTFNIAGLNCAYAICANETLKSKLDKIIQQREIGSINVFGTVAMQAAYEEGKPWLKALLPYLNSNIQAVQEALQNTKIRFNPPEATYLLWLDFSAYKLPHEIIKKMLYDEAKVVLNDGKSFGRNGCFFFRLNVATQKEQLLHHIHQMVKVFQTI
jgi:cystathionine beta-lyase